MTALRRVEERSLLQICRKAQSEAGTSGRVQSGHDQTELEGRGKERGERVQ